MTTNIFNTDGLHPHIAAMVATDALFSKLPTRLLSVSTDAKTVKGETDDILTGIIYLSPADTVSTKYTLCPYADIAGCKDGCLNTAGRGRFSNVQRARIRKALFWQQYRADFMALLVTDIKRLIIKAARLGMTPAVRLNGTSDICWENIPVGPLAITQFGNPAYETATVFDLFPNVQFYDYTKIPGRTTPDNYHLTFSYSGREIFRHAVVKQLKHSEHANIAVVFADRLPSEFLGRPVINGDASDVRFNDDAGVIVGLLAKGDAKTDHSGFVCRMGA